jgi:hypothetical protein
VEDPAMSSNIGPVVNERVESNPQSSQIVTNVSASTSTGVIDTANRTFHFFSSLPAELRFMIWEAIVDCPRIVEFEKRQVNYAITSRNGSVRYLEGPWEYRTKEIPTTFLVSRDCRQTAVERYPPTLGYPISPIIQRMSRRRRVRREPAAHAVGAPIFFRPTIDVAHMKDFDFRSSQTGLAGSQTYEFRLREVRNERLTFVPITEEEFVEKIRFNSFFKHTLELALSRDIFLRTSHPAEWLIKKMFPKLEVLSILIDDETDIAAEWDITDGDYYHYEDYMQNESTGSVGLAREEFCAAATGPFTRDLRNVEYGRWAVFDIKQAFAEEESEDPNYTAPLVVASGCSLREGDDLNREYPGRKHPKNCSCKNY